MDSATIAEAIKVLSARTGADGVSIIPRKDGGVDIRLIDRELYVTLAELSERLPTKPTIPVLKKTCNRLGVKIGKIGGKPCVSIAAFERAMEATA